ncbi:MAG: SdrD B-like domain-containing protein [Chloroflexota bacterium]
MINHPLQRRLTCLCSYKNKHLFAVLLGILSLYIVFPASAFAQSESINIVPTASSKLDASGVQMDHTVNLVFVSGASLCEGSNQVSVIGSEDTANTYEFCFAITNTGDTWLTDFQIELSSIELDHSKIVQVSGALPLSPTESIKFSYETVITGSLVNTATVTALPSLANGTVISGATAVASSDTSTIINIPPISGIVWRDQNQDGSRDVDEPLMENITAELYASSDCSGSPLDSTTTDTNGEYAFSLRPIGDYCVQFRQIPLAWVLSPQDQGDDDTIDSDAVVTDDPQIAQVTNLNIASGLVAHDMGVYPLVVSVGDRVWEDLNGDGIQDAGEPNFPDVEVSLYLADGTEDGLATGMTTTTDADGLYLFDDLTPQEYFVIFNLSTLPDGYVVTTQNTGGNNSTSDITDSDADPSTGRTENSGFLIGGDSTTNLDMGVYVPVEVGGRVWSDSNSNGLQDAGEPGVANVTVNLFEDDGTDTNLSATTDILGEYRFTGLRPGVYYVKFDLDSIPEGFQPTMMDAGDDALDSDAALLTSENPGQTPTTAFLESNQSNTTLDMGLVLPVEVGGEVWLDTNSNGIQDVGEVGVPNINVALFHEDGTAVTQDDVPMTDITNANGGYVFRNLPPASYYVAFDISTLPDLQVVAEPNAGDDDTIDSDANPSTGQTPATTLLPSGAVDWSLDMGIVQLNGLRVGDRVWEDLNVNGTQDVAEPGVAGVVVTLFDSNDEQQGQATTDENGNYLFERLPLASYYVVFDISSLPAGYLVTSANMGDNDAIDSDADPSTGQTTATGELGDGEQALNLDMGVYRPASIGDMVWDDADGNGLREDGEVGLADVTVNLLDSDGQPTGQSVTTSVDGTYLFASVTPGIYQLAFMTPEGYFLSPANQSNDSANSDQLDSDADQETGVTSQIVLLSGENDLTIDAGMYLGASVQGQVWRDIDGNGFINSANPGARAGSQDDPPLDPDDAEVGVSGVQVMVFTELGLLAGQTVSDPDGEYIVDGLVRGNYYLEFDEPEELVYTVIEVEENPAEGIDSDVDPWEGQTELFLLESGAVLEGVNAGLTEPAGVSNYVWVDEDGDGIKDPEEAGVGNMVVNMYNRFNELIATTVTDLNGYYEFQGVTPDEYGIEYLPPAGFEFSDEHQFGETGDRNQISLNPGEIDTISAPAPLVPEGASLGPTVIDLVSFTAAHQEESNSIVVTWETGSEVNTYGFYLYRGTDGDRNNAARITANLIFSTGDSETGATYTYVDESILSDVIYVYWLREIENDGTGNFYGPAGVAVGSSSDVQLHTIYLPMITN